MRGLLKPLQWVYCLYAYALFIALMLVIFPFVLVVSFFGRIRGGNLAMRLCMLWADIWFPMILIFFKRIYEAPHDRKNAYIFISNHISYLDAALIPKVYRQAIRPLGKVEISRIPVFGSIYRRVIVTVDRSNPENRARSVRILQSVIRKGISVLVFPEGTFNMSHEPLKSFYDGAFRVAIETQTPLKPVLILDSYSRMNYKSVFSLKPGRCRIVYLDEIPVAGLSTLDVAKLKEKAFVIMSEKLREYGAAWIENPATAHP